MTGNYRAAVAVTSVVLAAAAAQTGTAMPPRAPLRTVQIATAAALRDALAAARPGDHIVVASGEYEGAFDIRNSGTPDRPIVVRSAVAGRAVFVGQTQLDVRAAWIVIEGFRFSQAHGVRLVDSANVRVTRNHFRLSETENEGGRGGETLHWLSIRGSRSHHNRVDHNLFEVKRTRGHFVLVEGSSEPAALSQRDRIDHNHFRDAGPFGEGMEAMRIGVSRLSLLSSFTVIEHNLFEGCDGDMEIISVKATDVTVRHNTIDGSQGALTARHGHRARFIGNTIMGRGRTNTGGFRLYGDDHQVVGNYVEGVQDEPDELVALALDTSIVDHPPPYAPGELASYFRVRRALIAFNTFVGNRHTLRIGATTFVRAADGSAPETWTRGSLNPRLPPTGLVIANNIFSAAANNDQPLIRVMTTPEATTWAGNLMFASGPLAAGIEPDVLRPLLVDPRFERRGGRLMLRRGSPAIDRAQGEYPAVVTDLEGQARRGPRDIGADEYSSAPIRCPLLTPREVGPDAKDRTDCPLAIP
jgi:poly(beta-D-mannuronate) lyase